MNELCEHLVRECTNTIDEYEIGSNGFRLREWTCTHCGVIEYDTVELPAKRVIAS